ncbi:MAG: DinB family protein [Pseudooceanicola sp.]|nr:DinB family protein [Pseudooceanicola sp.]
MIDAAYAVTMARYNRWQNSQLQGFLERQPAGELVLERGAFFGSILKTLSHLCWGDHIWLSRFDGGSAPPVGAAESVSYAGDLDAWVRLREELDARILTWARGLGDLSGDLTWYSGAAGREVSKPLAELIVHFFNHQTHHRGQVHAMLTATGSKAPVSDLFLMPE